MSRSIVLTYLTIAVFCIPSAISLQCYYCNDCDVPTQIICNATAAQNLNEILKGYFDLDSVDEQDTYDCITLAYMSKAGNRYGKIRGCTYNSPYACSLKPRNQAYSYICYTCDSDYCNSAGNYTNARIFLTLLATVFAAVVAHLL